jgi:magnesium chelatase family protein
VFARLLSAVVVGVEAHLVEVQCDVTMGLPSFQVVGLPEKEVTESRERIRSAIRNSGYRFPAQRITANLAPADERKAGVGFDLPIALGILIASDQLPGARQRHLLVGELGLDGTVRGIAGALPLALAAAEAGLDGVVVPRENAGEAALVDGVGIYPVRTLVEAAAFLVGGLRIDPFCVDRDALLALRPDSAAVDLAEVKGQEHAKRALEIAAAGGHSLLLIGPPGAGKSLLARALPGILPPLSLPEALEVTRVQSAAGRIRRDAPLATERPFRAPHHTISYAGMVGGGHGLPAPGEISLAHHGVLFLDELPEFDRRVLEALRQPIEDRAILLARAGASVRYPAGFTLVGAMNPCLCGYLGDPQQACSCSPRDVRRYRKRLSGPFLDRVDLFVEVPRLSSDEILARRAGEPSAAVRARVEAARRIQWARMKDRPNRYSNAQLEAGDVLVHCSLLAEARSLLRLAIDRFALSARATTRVLKVARTIADLSAEPSIRGEHVAEAIQYRRADETTC